MFRKTVAALGIVGIGLAGGWPCAAQFLVPPVPTAAKTPEAATAAPIPAPPPIMAPPVPVPPPIPVPPVPVSGPNVALVAAAAQSGIADDQWRLGELYHDGRGVPKDTATAAVWLRKAARHGSRGAMNALAGLYTETDAPKPQAGEPDWRQLAADEGWGAAQDAIGHAYATGDGRPKDLVAAYKWLNLAATATAGPIWSNASTTLRDEIAAELTPAQLTQARAEVADWLSAPSTPDQIADKGWAAYNLQQYDLAITLLTPVATAGNAQAQYYLGVAYMNGHGTLQGDTAAQAWFQKAADQGHAGAEHLLGLVLTNAKGMSKEPVAAAQWETKAARQGLSTAEDLLGLMYSKGFGLPSDEAATAFWLKKAAAQGLGRAQYQLGGLYTFGVGVPKDMVQAYKWKYLATIYPASDPKIKGEAKADLDWMAASMTPAQVDQAVAAAKAWTPVFEVVP